MILLLRTKHTTSGNPRRAYFVFNTEGQVVFAEKDHDYKGAHTVPPGFRYKHVTDVSVSVGEYNRLCKRLGAK